MKFHGDSNPKLNEYIIIFIFFIFLTVLLTFPMIFHLSDTIGGGDEAFTCWSLAWTTHSLITNPLNIFHANIFYPANDYSFALSEHLIGWAPFSIPVYLLTNDPVFTHNLLRLLTFVLCGFGAYFLSYYYTNNRYAAIIAGICFAFFSYRLTIQLHLLAMEWIPFLILYLDRFFHSVKYRDMIAFTIFFLLSTLSGWYVGIFTGIIVTIYFLGYILLDKKVRTRIFSKQALGMLLISLIIIILILIPIAIPYFHASTLYDAERGLEDPIKSALSLDIISILSLFGPISIILAIVGFYLPININNDEKIQGSYVRKQKIPIIFGIIACFSYMLMLGPVLKIGGEFTGNLMPYYFIYQLIPFIAIVRDLSRFSFVMSFAISMLAGFGALVIISRFKNNNPQNLVSIILVLLVIAGSWHIPVSMPSSLATGDNIPKEYRWLANQTGDPVIIEIPTRWVEDNSEYTYYSVYHWKQMVNGYSGRDVEESSKIMRDTSEFFPSNNTISLLQHFGVRYVFIHADRMSILYNTSPDNIQNFEFSYIQNINSKINAQYSSSVRFVNSFNRTYIYEILQDPVIDPDEEVLIFENGWIGSNIIQPFYLKNAGYIKVLAPEDGDYVLKFIAQPISDHNSLTLIINNETIGSDTLKTGGFSEGNSIIHLNKGFNEVKFTSNGCTKLCDIPEMNTISNQCISFVFANLTIFK